MPDMTDNDESIPGLNILPIANWELPKARKVLPDDLCTVLEAEAWVLRVHPAIDAKVRTKHRRDVPAYERMNELLQAWHFARRSGAEPGKWEIFVSHEGVWIVIVLGRDREDGCFNLVTFHNKRSSAVERIRKEEGVVENEAEKKG